MKSSILQAFHSPLIRPDSCQRGLQIHGAQLVGSNLLRVTPAAQCPVLWKGWWALVSGAIQGTWCDRASRPSSLADGWDCCSRCLWDRTRNANGRNVPSHCPVLQALYQISLPFSKYPSWALKWTQSTLDCLKLLNFFCNSFLSGHPRKITLNYIVSMGLNTYFLSGTRKNAITVPRLHHDFTLLLFNLQIRLHGRENILGVAETDPSWMHHNHKCFFM